MAKIPRAIPAEEANAIIPPRMIANIVKIFISRSPFYNSSIILIVYVVHILIVIDYRKRVWILFLAVSLMDKFQNDSAAAGIAVLHGSCPVNKETAP